MGTFPRTVPGEAMSPSAWGKGRGVSIKGDTKGQGRPSSSDTRESRWGKPAWLGIGPHGQAGGRVRMPEASVLEGRSWSYSRGRDCCRLTVETTESLLQKMGWRAGRKGLWFKGNDLMTEKQASYSMCVCVPVHHRGWRQAPTVRVTKKKELPWSPRHEICSRQGGKAWGQERCRLWSLV